MKEEPKMPREEIGDRKERQSKKSAKVEMPDRLVLTEKEHQEEMKRRKENPHWWRENP